jgi:hypothetical protein
MTEYRGAELTDWAGQRGKLITMFILGALPLFALFGYMVMIGGPGT